MNIAMGNDHAAVREKQALLEALTNMGHQVIDLGCDSDESTDYPDYAARVAHAVTGGRADLGILLCGTGIGMSIAANKIHGVRAALCHSPETAAKSREHNDANILCCGARVMDLANILATASAFLTTPFAGGRHARRVQKMMALETEQ